MPTQNDYIAGPQVDTLELMELHAEIERTNKQKNLYL